MSNPEDGEAGSLKIGAVSRLSGVSTHTVRKWEQRYGAVTPRRTETGKRLYSHADVERLRLIRHLSESGLSLREIARYSAEELQRAWDRLAGAGAPAGQSRPLRVAVLGTGLGAHLTRRQAATAMLQLVAHADGISDLVERLAGRPVDLVLMESPTVRREAREQLQAVMAKLGVQRAVVVYRFAGSAELLALRSPHVALLRAPADPTDLERAALELMAGAAQEPPPVPATAESATLPPDIPPRRITERAMARLLAEVPRIRCECPHHLVDILLSLRAFEDYSQECQNASPQDAELHCWLWQRTAAARAIFEQVVERVAAAEGVSLEDGDLQTTP